MTLPRLYTPEEVAEEIGHISPATIRSLVREGKIASVRGGRGAVLFTEDLVREMLELLTVRPRADADASLDSDEEDVDPDDIFDTTPRSKARARSAAARSLAAKPRDLKTAPLAARDY